MVGLWFLPLQFSIWILIQPLHLPPLPASGDKGWQLGPLGEAAPLGPSEAVVGIWGATPGPRPGWRNLSAALWVGPQGSPHHGGTSEGLRRCRGVRGMGHKVSAHIDVASSRSFEKAAHGSAPRLIFEAHPAPPPLPSAPLAGERAGNHTRGGRQSFQFCSQRRCYGFFLCVCVFPQRRWFGSPGLF